MEKFICEANYINDMQNVALPYITERRTDEHIPSFDSNPIHIASFKADEPHGTVVVVHGYTESIEKYHEVIYYLLVSGYNVIIYEQRGHGTSYRAVDDKTLTHIESFDEYVLDLETVVKHAKEGSELPMYLLAHSMGGAVAALYLEKHPNDFAKAVLLSPMIAPSTNGVPAGITKLIARTAILFGKGKKRVFVMQPYPGKEHFEDSCASSQARFDYYEAIKSTHEDFQNYSASYKWMLESVKVTRKILKKGEVEKITIPVLMAQATDDTTVLLVPQNEFAKRLPNCKVIYARCKHETFRAHDEVWNKLLDDILGFLA